MSVQDVAVHAGVCSISVVGFVLIENQKSCWRPDITVAWA